MTSKSKGKLLVNMGAAALSGVLGLSGIGAAYGDDADDKLEKRIEMRLEREGKLAVDKIDVDVEAGVATLKGRVASDAERARAAKLARTGSVKRVDNQLVVDVDIAKDRIEDRAEDRAEAAKDRVDERAKQQRKTGASEELGDTWITTKVKTGFVGEATLKGSDISVDTEDDGVVRLTGTVTTEAGRARAIQIAKETKGVRHVVDNLRIGVDR